MNNFLIINNLGKKYTYYKNRWAHLIGIITKGRFKNNEQHWVLKNINFSVKQGESVGIVGQNGSGKSTLLKIVTGIIRSSTGIVKTQGKIAALLELGIGFNGELTGRQNAEMTCQLYGFSRHEINKLLPAIAEFAELGDYFEKPVRTYSTGMQVRLAFSAATVVRPDILIIDEALSVGDIYFQHKSIARIREFKTKGTTLFLVSHDLGAIKSLCDRAILLDNGNLIADSSPEFVLDYYNALISAKEKANPIFQNNIEAAKVAVRSGNGKAKIEFIDMINAEGEACRVFKVGETATLKCKVRYFELVKEPTVGIIIRDRLGNDIFGTNTDNLKHPIPIGVGFMHIEFKLQLNLGHGSYSITIASHAASSHMEENHDWWDNALIFEILLHEQQPFIGVSYLPLTVTSEVTG